MKGMHRSPYIQTLTKPNTTLQIIFGQTLCNEIWNGALENLGKDRGH